MPQPRWLHSLSTCSDRFVNFNIARDNSPPGMSSIFPVSPTVVLPFGSAGLGKAVREAFDINRADAGFAQGCLPSGADAHPEVFQERGGFFALQTECRRAGQCIGKRRLVSPLAYCEDQTSV